MQESKIVTRIAALRAIHTRGAVEDWCSSCNQLRPCDAALLLEVIDELQRKERESCTIDTKGA